VEYVLKKNRRFFTTLFLLVICLARIMGSESESELGGEYAREKIE
jgi:hypothetical protein